MENNSLCTVPNCTACTKPVVTNNNEWIEKKLHEFLDRADVNRWDDEFGCTNGDAKAYHWLEQAFKDCQRKTLELILPEKHQLLDVPVRSEDYTRALNYRTVGFNDCRSEILRRASEAGITIDDL